MPSVLAAEAKPSALLDLAEADLTVKHPSGFWGSSPALSGSSLAAAVVMALQSGLIEEPARACLPFQSR